MLKKEDGISLIQVIVAIIIMIIITSFAIWYASNTSTEAKLTRLYAETSAVKEAYENAKILNELNPGTINLDELLLKEEDINSALSEYGVEDISFIDYILDRSELYLITPENAKMIEAEKITQSFIVDGKTDNVYLIGGFKRNDAGAVAFEYKEILKLYNSTLK